MADEKTQVTVDIFGIEYPIKGDADPEYIREVARYVDSKMRQVSRSGSVGSTIKVAVAAALNLTDELFKERAEKQNLISEMNERVTKLVRMLDKELDEYMKKTASRAERGEIRKANN
ncbi:MAG TPA: cell division protein ZapA [Candidatus Latescibacteria bacterium]|nr:cell division protein ZapA [Candidatus Latescibacterota bacterium]